MQPPSWRLVALCHVVGVIVGVWATNAFWSLGTVRQAAAPPQSASPMPASHAAAAELLSAALALAATSGGPPATTSSPPPTVAAARRAAPAAPAPTRQKAAAEPPRDVSLAAMRAWDLSGAGPCPSDLKVYVYEYPGVEDMPWHRHASVSYTHLTLPTILLV